MFHLVSLMFHKMFQEKQGIHIRKVTFYVFETLKHKNYPFSGFSYMRSFFTL